MNIILVELLAPEVLQNSFQGQFLQRECVNSSRVTLENKDGMRSNRCHLTSIFKASSAEQHTAQRSGPVFPPCWELFIHSLQGKFLGWKGSIVGNSNRHKVEAKRQLRPSFAPSPWLSVTQVRVPLLFMICCPACRMHQMPSISSCS